MRRNQPSSGPIYFAAAVAPLVGSLAFVGLLKLLRLDAPQLFITVTGVSYGWFWVLLLPSAMAPSQTGAMRAGAIIWISSLLSGVLLSGAVLVLILAIPHGGGSVSVAAWVAGTAALAAVSGAVTGFVFALLAGDSLHRRTEYRQMDSGTRRK